MARMQLIAGLVSVGLSILATLLAVDEIEVQVRRREAEPMERLQRAGVRVVAKLPGAPATAAQDRWRVSALRCEQRARLRPRQVDPLCGKRRASFQHDRWQTPSSRRR